MDQIPVRRLGDLAPIVGGLSAVVGLVVIALVVDRSGCGGGEFDCLERSIYAGTIALIPGGLVALGVLWVAALTPTTGGSARRSPWLALVFGAVAASAWVLLLTPLGFFLLLGGGGAIPQGVEPIRADALAISAIVVGAVVTLTGSIAARAARRGPKALGWLMLAGFVVPCGGYLVLRWWLG
ncbi:hypothetical protein Afe04nite_10790 [Asanoa ferruginea]|uniref:hypothetical protein n=1 Tax=Asanoa ferruginea TaxID=53367 RepID=UPI000E26325A|nr:hypothetical protein [Asanoa ferruginea]GIF46540.1 hypothetical protein Afe04nite_10790 [Asanoa ferruginea]